MLYKHVFGAVITAHHVFKLPPLLHLCVVNALFQLQQKKVFLSAPGILSILLS